MRGGIRQQVFALGALEEQDHAAEFSTESDELPRRWGGSPRVRLGGRIGTAPRPNCLAKPKGRLSGPQGAAHLWMTRSGLGHDGVET